MVVLDLGNWTTRKNPSYGYSMPVTMECLERMGYDALAIGDKEVSLGLARTDTLLKQHNLIGLNANIVSDSTGEPRFTPYRVIRAGDLKVGVTSVIGGDAVIARTIKEREGIRVEDPIETGRAMLEQLRRKKVDLTVLIAHTGLRKGEILADSLSGYDVVLIGHGGNIMAEPKKEKGVILAAAGSRSNQLGYLTLVVENRTVTNFEGKSWQLQQNDGPVDEVVKDLTWTHLELDENGVRIKKRKTNPAESTDSTAATDGADAAKTPPPTKAYLGNDKCRACHADIYASYMETPHANAFEVIAKSEENWQKGECWNCHVLGYGEPTGHSTTELQPDLWNVQCESCHGMGTEHSRGGEMAKVTEETCTACHVEKWSPGFDYASALKKVAHKSKRTWN